MCLHDPSFSHIDCLFSCSHWTFDDRTPSQVIQCFVAKIEESCKELIDRGIEESSTSYGQDETEAWTVWGKEEECDSLLIWLHGGYWQEGSRSCASPIVLPLLSQGVLVVSLGYNLASPTRSILHIIRDIVPAVQKLLDRYPTKGRVVIGGHSAGAQLAFKVASSLSSPRITGLALFSGVFQLQDIVDTVVGRPINLTTEDAVRCSCSADELDSGEVEVLLVVGDYDSPVLRSQSVEMYQGLKRRAIKAQLKEMAGEDHFSLIQGLSDPSNDQTKSLLQFTSNQAL